jgi:RimJ/RimL family protein N-acetyltransferase
MDELQKDHYTRVRPVFDTLRYNLVIDSVIAGNTPGKVWVDNEQTPRVALMWDYMDALLLAGEAQYTAVNQSLAALLNDTIVPEAKAYLPELTLFYAPTAWEDQIDILLPDHQPIKAQRRYYEFGHVAFDWRAAMPHDCEMRRIDEALLTDTHLENVRAVEGWVRSFWHTQRDFVETGFGFCVVRENVILSWCLSVFVSGRNFEFGIATAPDHRRQGFATLAAAACVEHCVENNGMPHWHCWEDNIPSIKVAEKVGFEHPTPYTVYRFDL